MMLPPQRKRNLNTTNLKGDYSHGITGKTNVHLVNLLSTEAYDYEHKSHVTQYTIFMHSVIYAVVLCYCSSKNWSTGEQ
jgi:hypothetical protein